MIRYDIWIQWQLDTVTYLLGTVSPYLESQARKAHQKGEGDFGPDGSLSKFSLTLGSHKMPHNAVLYELNALVEEMFLSFAGRALPSEKRVSVEAFDV